MKPNIDFHDIAAIELEPVMSGETSHGPYHTRAIILTDSRGERFRFGLFAADSAAQLRIVGDGPDTDHKGRPVDMLQPHEMTHGPAVDPETGKVIPW